MHLPNSWLYFDKAIGRSDPPEPLYCHMNKGICSARLGQYPLAQAYLEGSLAANPQFFPAFKELARQNGMAGNPERCRLLFRPIPKQSRCPQADDLLLGWRLPPLLGNKHAAYEYEAQLRANFLYSDELQTVTTGH